MKKQKQEKKTPESRFQIISLLSRNCIAPIQMSILIFFNSFFFTIFRFCYIFSSNT